MIEVMKKSLTKAFTSTFKKYWRDVLALSTIAILSLLFLRRLFFPELSLIVTPDFGISDSWNYNISMKFYLWENIRNFHIPVWTNLIGNGTPLLGEGQIGIFFLPNLLLAFLLGNFAFYYNLLILLALITAGSGMYFWFRSLSVGIRPALFASITLMFSGVFVPQFTHLNYLQALSLTPWIMFITEHTFRKNNLSVIISGALVVSQQIFAGFPQAVFIASILVLVRNLLRQIDMKQKMIGFLPIVSIYLLAFLLSAVQLLPSYEFKNNLVSKGTYLGNSSIYYSYPFNHLLTLFNPFLFGNPQNGTYPPFFNNDGSIFWENSAYIGILPLLLIACYYLFGKKKKNSSIEPVFSIFLFLALLALLLMTGKHSPIYFVHTLFPFNSFRVPSRFISLFVISLIGLAAVATEQIIQRLNKPWGQWLLNLVLVIHALTFFRVWQNYHAYYPASKWLTIPVSSRILSSVQSIKTIGYGKFHNETFLKSGWSQTDPYFQMRQYFQPNSNLLWDLRQNEAYLGRDLYRNYVFKDSLDREIQLSSSTAEISALGVKLLQLSGVDNVISPYIIKSPTTATQANIQDYPFHAYQITDTTPNIYQAHSVYEVNTIETALSVLKSEHFITGKDALVETMLTISSASAKLSDLNLEKNTGNASVIVDASENGTLLIYNQTFYPGWKAYIDGKETKIQPVNIRYQGIIVPAGQHTISWEFHSDSYRRGAVISLTSYTLIFLVIVFIQRNGRFKSNRLPQRR
jgi:hypothetical protein